MTKALLLCGGYGKRLLPYTKTTPKPLIKIGNRPIIEWWLSKLEEIECEEVIINTHYLPEQIESYLKYRHNSAMKIKISYEYDLLGTGGTVYKHRKEFENNTGIMIHSDNMTNQGLEEIVEAYNKRPPNIIGTMLTFDCEDPTSCGIVKVDRDNILREREAE